MGTKFSKAKSDVNPKSISEAYKSSELPETSVVHTEDKDCESKTLPRHLDRSRSFSKRFRRSCRNWAVGRGLITDKKAESTVEVETKENDVTKSY